jgi:hypothetical protein
MRISVGNPSIRMHPVRTINTEMQTEAHTIASLRTLFGQWRLPGSWVRLPMRYDGSGPGNANTFLLGKF